MVCAVDVEKYFGSFQALKGINLALPRGEVLCIIGPSGSGKSTFLRCINQLERADRGAIWVDGELVGFRRVGDALHELVATRELARQRLACGMVFQRFNLFAHMTALQNIIEGPVTVQKRRRARGRRRGDGAARARGPGRQARRLSARALRRPAAARRHRPRAGDAAEADAVRRADLGARPGAGRRGAGRDARPRRARA